MNILSTNGLVGRYVTDWTGPGGVLTDVEIRLGAPNYPGDTMTLTGSVTEKEDPRLAPADRRSMARSRWRYGVRTLSATT